MKILLFGATGSIGSEIGNQLVVNGNSVISIGHDKNSKSDYWVESAEYVELIQKESFDGIIFAGGLNISDSIKDYQDMDFTKIVDANLIFILKCLRQLLEYDAFNKPSAILIVSSIWHSISRQNKLSYTVSKSAIDGLVRSLAIDLGEDGIRVNAIAPGVVNNKMTLQNLSKTQIEEIRQTTPIKNLVTETDVANSAIWLLSPNSTGITGQTINIDGGWSIAKYV